MRPLFFAWAAIAFLCFSAGVFAQTSNATLGGTVVDSTGTLIPGFEISFERITSTATGYGPREFVTTLRLNF